MYYYKTKKFNQLNVNKKYLKNKIIHFYYKYYCDFM